MKNLPYGEMLYPEDVVTEESMREVAQEIIREKILMNTKEEIPHSVAVLIEKYEEKEAIDRIFANIYCETKSQKGILIGKGGSLLKVIGTQARLELEKIVEKKVYLELNVKIVENNRNSQAAIAELLVQKGLSRRKKATEPKQNLTPEEREQLAKIFSAPQTLGEIISAEREERF